MHRKIAVMVAELDPRRILAVCIGKFRKFQIALGLFQKT
jgi:hypothetical protein